MKLITGLAFIASAMVVNGLGSVLASAALAAPSGLSATALSVSRVRLIWFDNSSSETGFEVFRKLSSGTSFTKLSRAAANQVTFEDATASASTTYSYKVRAYRVTSRGTTYSTFSRIAQATTPSITAPSPAPTPSPTASSGVYKPAMNTSWQWQLTGQVDQSVDVEMYDIDLFDNTASTVAALHAKAPLAGGRTRKVICYLSAGSYENWRPDAAQFSPAVLGKALDGWAGERWLDIRNLQVLGPILQARLDQCKAKGFDGVEPDNVDGYANDTGFPLTYQDQLVFNRWLADQAHARGLSIALKNDLDQVEDLVGHFDWALNEECFRYGECNRLDAFLSAGKAVFHVEYGIDTSRFCPDDNLRNRNGLHKNLDLDAWVAPCR